MNALRFWLGFVGWSLASLAEMPLLVMRRLLVGSRPGSRPADCPLCCEWKESDDD